VCSDLIAYDTKHARIGLHDIYIAASNEKFNVLPIPHLLLLLFEKYRNTKHGNRKQLITLPEIQFFFCITVNWNTVL
jgi:hypothetical protein